MSHFTTIIELDSDIFDERVNALLKQGYVLLGTPSNHSLEMPTRFLTQHVAYLALTEPALCG